MYESQDKMVSHPSHYQSESGLEVITVIEAFTANLDGMEAYDTGNILKYICRWKQKNGVQDLEKAAWYLQHLINYVMKDQKTPDPEATVEQCLCPVLPIPNFDKEGDAKYFVEAMLTLLKEYGKVWVDDALYLLGEAFVPNGHTFGWDDLDKIGYYRDLTDGKYAVVLPDPINLEKGEEK